MEPCLGYKLNMMIEDTLLYQVGQYVKVEIESSPWQVLSGTQYNMVLMSEIYSDMVFDNIGVFDNEGNCRSIGIKQNVNNKEFWYFTIVGNEENETLKFKLHNNKIGETYESNETIQFIDNATIGTPEEPIKLNVTETIADLPTHFNLEQNYPNPFNHTTKISYSIPEASNVDLKIYNIKGELVRILISEDKGAGYHSMIWDGKDRNGNVVGNGFYLIQIENSKFNFVKKVIKLN